MKVISHVSRESSAVAWARANGLANAVADPHQPILIIPTAPSSRDIRPVRGTRDGLGSRDG